MNQSVASVKVDVSEFSFDGSILVGCFLAEHFLYFIVRVSWEMVTCR